MKKTIVALLGLLLAACITPQPGESAPANPSLEFALGLVEGLTDGSIQTIGTEWLRKQPDGDSIIRTFDKPTVVQVEGQPDVTLPPDGVLTLAEIRTTLTASSPQELAGRVAHVVAMYWAIREVRKAAKPPG